MIELAQSSERSQKKVMDKKIESAPAADVRRGQHEQGDEFDN